MITTQTEVFCTLTIEGTHFWPDCNLEEVYYLRDEHRHLFHIKACKIVLHDNRQTEFIILKHDIKSYLLTQYHTPATRICNFGAMSCEMIAKELIAKFNLSRCEVSEDQENGSVVTVVLDDNECSVCGNPKQEGCQVC